MTKNMEAAGVPDKSSTTTAEFFDREVICPPAEALSDQGGEFQGDLPALLARQMTEDLLNWDKQIPRVLLGCRSSAQASCCMDIARSCPLVTDTEPTWYSSMIVFPQITS
ncbi:TPA: hypothetical protein ACH3X3_010469 [Trebouxia sp. C0006]